jgi:hypothetical protein
MPAGYLWPLETPAPPAATRALSLQVAAYRSIALLDSGPRHLQSAVRDNLPCRMYGCGRNVLHLHMSGKYYRGWLV